MAQFVDRQYPEPLPVVTSSSNSPFIVGKGRGMLGATRDRRGTIFRTQKNADDPNEVVKVAEQLDESKYRRIEEIFRESDRGRVDGGDPVVVPANDLAQRASDRRVATRRCSPGRCTIECRIVRATRVSITSEAPDVFREEGNRSDRKSSCAEAPVTEAGTNARVSASQINFSSDSFFVAFT